MENLVETVLRAHAAKFGKIIENAADFRFQVLLSEVVDDGIGNASLVRHGFRVGSEYFYPASAIKLCVAIAALQKLERIEQALGLENLCSSGITLYPFSEREDLEHCDSTNLHDGRITIAHELRKLFLVSDNEAFNRLYDFVGHRRMNEAMWNANLLSTRLRHHLSESSSSSGIMNTACRPVGLDGVSATIPPKQSGLDMPENTPSEGLSVGSCHVLDKCLVSKPMDFSMKNCITLLDLQNLLIKVTRRDIQLDESGIGLSKESTKLLLESMSQFPAESSNPRYDKIWYPDDFCKPFLPGLCRVRSKGALRIYNKVGLAFGFTTDNAYIVDLESGKSFYLAATIYTNANGTVNDDHYEYELASSVMADLAEELARAVWHLPATNLCSTRLDGPGVNEMSGSNGSNRENTTGTEAQECQDSPSKLGDSGSKSGGTCLAASTSSSIVGSTGVSLRATKGVAESKTSVCGYVYFIDE